MVLRLLKKNGDTEEIKGIQRVFTTKYANNTKEALYYEKFTDESGKGSFLDLGEIKCWEVVAEVQGGNLII